MPARLQRVVGHADDERAFPIFFTGDIAIVGGIYRRETRLGVAENVDALMGAAAGVGAARIGVEQTDETVGGQDEGRAGASFALYGDEIVAGRLVAGGPLQERLAVRVVEVAKVR